jgi:Ca2+-binding RTX toxin-like protein
VGTAGDDRLVGTEGPDVIVALAGRDVVLSGGGDDVVCGGAGPDRLIGESGGDTLNGQRGSDSLFGHAGGAADDSAVDYLKGGRGSDSLNYLQCLTYSRHCPEVDGGDDFISGGPGRDLIAACDDGQRTIRGGRGADGAVFCSSVTADLEEGSASFDSGAELEMVGFENLYGSAWQTDTLIGDDGPNLIYTGFDGEQRRGVPDEARGGGGADAFVFGDQDVVDGEAGRDWFLGGIPSDDRGFANLSGGDGDDRFLMCFGASSNLFDGADYAVSGGEGVDVVEFGLSGMADLSLGTAVCSDFAGALTGIEGLRGGGLDDTLRGDGNDNLISGGRGDDVLEGRGGHDVLDGGRGTDDCSTGEEVQRCETVGQR